MQRYFNVQNDEAGGPHKNKTAKDAVEVYNIKVDPKKFRRKASNFKVVNHLHAYFRNPYAVNT